MLLYFQKERAGNQEASINETVGPERFIREVD